MNKQEIYDYLNSRGIRYEITEHGAVYNMEDLSSVALPYPEADAKNIFVRDDKKRNYFLITVKGDTRVDLKEFRRRHGTRNLSFASADDLSAILGLIPGAVTPLGLLNDKESSVQFFLDRSFLDAPGAHRRPSQRQYGDRLDKNRRPDPPDRRTRQSGLSYVNRCLSAERTAVVQIGPGRLCVKPVRL